MLPVLPAEARKRTPQKKRGTQDLKDGTSQGQAGSLASGGKEGRTSKTKVLETLFVLR